MNLIYETPFDVFDDLERKELIRITRKNCPGCTSEECHAPQIIIPNKEKFKSFLDIQIQKAEVEIEKLGLSKIRNSDEDSIRIMYGSLIVARELQENTQKFLDIMGVNLSDIDGLLDLLKDLDIDDDISGPLTGLFGKD